MNKEKCDCVGTNLIIQSVVIILLVVLFCQIYKLSVVQNEYLTGDRGSIEGGYLSKYLDHSGYVGVPLINSVDDSGANLRILGQQFTSTDQRSERFKNKLRFIEKY